MVDILQVKLRYAAYAEAGCVTTIDAADAAQIVELCEMAERAYERGMHDGRTAELRRIADIRTRRAQLGAEE